MAYFFLNQYVELSNLYDLDYLQGAILGLGVFAPLGLILTMALAIIVFVLPSFPIDLAAGVLFGPYLGTLYVVLGGVLGGTVSFYLARKLGRNFIEHKLKQHKIYFDHHHKHLFWIVFLLRVFPIVHFSAVCYAAGLTNMNYKKFLLATFLGMIPSSFLLVYFGNELYVGNVFTIVISLFVISVLFVIGLLVKTKK